MYMYNQMLKETKLVLCWPVQLHYWWMQCPVLLWGIGSLVIHHLWTSYEVARKEQSLHVPVPSGVRQWVGGWGGALNHVMNNCLTGNTHAHMYTHVYWLAKPSLSLSPPSPMTIHYNMCKLGVWQLDTQQTCIIYQCKNNVEWCMRVTRLIETNSSMQSKISCSNNNMHSPCKYGVCDRTCTCIPWWSCISV